MTGGCQHFLSSCCGKRVFVDLKVPGDISNTISAVIDVCYEHRVGFLHAERLDAPGGDTVAAAARDAHRPFDLKLLTVPFLSSLDASDLVETTGTTDDLETYVLTRAKRSLDAGCDGVIASGDAIQWCRAAFPHPTLIVSPGIRPAGAAPDDQKRHTTPADAIRRGADYLVVGRPILGAPDPRAAAETIIEEIDAALRARVS